MKTSQEKKEKLRKHKEERRKSRAVVWKVFKRDFKRMVTNPLLCALMIAVLVFPSLYAWCGIGANWDPYGQTGNVPVAVVIEDEPYNSPIAGTFNLGQTIREQLEQNNSIKWEFMDRETAMENVLWGTDYAAIVIPKDFSKSMCQIFEGQDVRDYAHFEYYVLERDNAIVIKVADTGASTLETQINEKFTGVVSSVVAQKIAEVSANIISGTKDVATTLADRLSMVANTVSGFKETIGIAGTANQQTQKSIEGFTKTLTSAQTEVGNISNTLNATKSTLTRTSANLTNLINELKEKIPELEAIIQIVEEFQQTINELNESVDRLIATNSELGTTLDKVINTITSLKNLMQRTSTVGSNLSESIDVICKQLDSAATKLNTMRDGSQIGIFNKILSMDPQAVGNFMSSPVRLQTEKISTVKNYGTGIAPFFCSITFWVAGIILVALLRTEVESPKGRKLTAKEAYLARGSLYSLIAIIQGAICAIGCLIIGIQCEQPALFILTGAVAGFTFVNIIYMLTACFKHVGKAMAIVLVVMQIPGASGTFPIEIMPSVFRAIHPFLPFTYSVSAMRETIVRFDAAWWFYCILILLVFWLISVLLGVYLRRALLNVNLLFERMIADAQIFISETSDHIVADEPKALEELTSTLAQSTSYGKKVKDSVDDFEKKYKRRSHRAVIYMAVIPQLYLIALCIIFNFVEFDINAKILFMLGWLTLLAICAAYIIALEFMHVRITSATKDKPIDNKSFAHKVESEYIDYA